MQTSNRGYTYPSMAHAATVPADLEAALRQVDADVQTLFDSKSPTGHTHTAASLTGLPALVGAQVGASVDAIINDRELVSRDELKTLSTHPLSGTDLIASRLAFRTGDITVGVASDSTSDGTTDWPRMWEAHLAARFPHLRIEHQQWVDAQSAYGPTTIVQEGTGEPAFSGDVIHDTFSRTTGLATPDEGGPWQVTTPEAFTLTGSTLAATSAGRLRLESGARDMTTHLVIDLDATGTGATQALYIYHGWSHGSMVQININAGGLATAYIYRRVGNANEMVTSQRLDLALGVPVNGDAGPVTIDIASAIQNQSVTITYDGVEWSHSWTITEAAYAAMEAEMSIFPQSAIPGMPIGEATVTVADRPSTYQTLRVLCGTKGGGTLDYQIENWEDMFSREVISPGSPGTEGTPGTVEAVTFTDTFTRTGGLSGSTADTGEEWTSGALWAADGTGASASGLNSAYVDIPEATAASASLELVTTAPTAAETFRLGMRATGNGVHGIYLTVGLSTVGGITCVLYVRTATGGYRGLATSMFNPQGEVNTATPQVLDISLALDGLTVTATAGTQTVSDTITQAEADELGELLELQAASAGTAPHFRVLEAGATYEVETPGDPGTPATDPVYGDPLDVMLISHGHNYGSISGDQYLGVIADFLAFMRERRPSTLPLFVTQNPQFAPAANPVAHARRQAAVRGFARQYGYGYAPVFEHFAAQADGGQAWVSSDGVHPTAPTTPTVTAGKGTSEWGGVLAGAVAY